MPQAQDLDLIGFGSLNIDEFWETPRSFLRRFDLEPGHEYVRDPKWFEVFSKELGRIGTFKAADPGGSAANMTACLQRMGFRTGFFGSTGRDDATRLRLSELGDSSDLAVSEVALPAGRCYSLTAVEDPAKDRALVITPNANDLAGAGPFDAAYFARARFLHLTSFVSDGPFEAQKRIVEALPRAVSVSFDPGMVYASRGFAALKPLLARADVVFASVDELAAMTDCRLEITGVRRLLSVGAAVVVVKHGERGLRAYTEDGVFQQPPTPPKKILDRTGAGDAAAAGFIAGRVEGMNPASCLELAALCASKSIEGFGRAAYPDAAFFSAFRNGRKTA
jgi:ribokinase